MECVSSGFPPLSRWMSTAAIDGTAARKGIRDDQEGCGRWGPDRYEDDDDNHDDDGGGSNG
jgi:hypothetical protein